MRHPILKTIAVGALAFPAACSGLHPPDLAIPTSAGGVVSLAYAYPENTALCGALADQLNAWPDSESILHALEIEGGWRAGQSSDHKTVQADINHDALSDRLHRFPFTRSAQLPVGEVEAETVLYQLGSKIAASTAQPQSAAEILKPPEEGGLYIRFDISRLEGGSRPFRLTDSVRMYRASVIELNKQAYLFLQSPPSGIMREPSYYLVDFVSSEPYVACRLVAAKPN